MMDASSSSLRNNASPRKSSSLRKRFAHIFWVPQSALKNGRQQDNFRLNCVNTNFSTWQTFLAWTVISSCSCFIRLQHLGRNNSKYFLTKMTSYGRTVCLCCLSFRYGKRKWAKNYGKSFSGKYKSRNIVTAPPQKKTQDAFDRVSLQKKNCFDGKNLLEYILQYFQKKAR